MAKSSYALEVPKKILQIFKNSKESKEISPTSDTHSREIPSYDKITKCLKISLQNLAKSRSPLKSELKIPKFPNISTSQKVLENSKKIYVIFENRRKI